MEGFFNYSLLNILNNQTYMKYCNILITFATYILEGKIFILI